MAQQGIPLSLQSVLWSSSIHTLDLEKDERYIIHQVLSHGAMDDLVWLFHTYPKQHISEVFSTIPFKDYRPQRFNLIKNYMLDLSGIELDERLYVINTPRNI